MARILFTTDTHFTNSNPKFKKDENGVSDFLIRQDKFFIWLEDLISKERCDIFCFLGDLTDNAILDPVTLFYTNRILSRLNNYANKKNSLYNDVYEENGFVNIILEGNHCITDVKNNYTVLSAIEQCFEGQDTGHTFVNSEFIYHIKQTFSQDVRFWIYPYISDYKYLEEKIRKDNDRLGLEKDDSFVDIMLFHFPCVNAMYDNGLKSVSGVHLTEDMTSNFDYVFGGDYHTHQYLQGNEKACYVGAPFTMKFGETNDRAIMILDTETGEIKRIQNPYNVKMLKIDYKDFDDSLDYTETILNIVNVPKDIELSVDCYKLYKSTKREGEKPKEMNMLDEEDILDDSILLAKEMRRSGYDKERISRVIDCYEEL